jgi:hypothetical protein
LDVSLQQGEDFSQFCLFSSDRAWLEDSSSPFSAAKSSTVNEKLGGDAA